MNEEYQRIVGMRLSWSQRERQPTDGDNLCVIDPPDAPLPERRLASEEEVGIRRLRCGGGYRIIRKIRAK